MPETSNEAREPYILKYDNLCKYFVTGAGKSSTADMKTEGKEEEQNLDLVLSIDEVKHSDAMLERYYAEMDLDRKSVV